MARSAITCFVLAAIIGHARCESNIGEAGNRNPDREQRTFIFPQEIEVLNLDTPAKGQILVVPGPHGSVPHLPNFPAGAKAVGVKRPPANSVSSSFVLKETRPGTLEYVRSDPAAVAKEAAKSEAEVAAERAEQEEIEKDLKLVKEVDEKELCPNGESFCEDPLEYPTHLVEKIVKGLKENPDPNLLAFFDNPEPIPEDQGAAGQPGPNGPNGQAGGNRRKTGFGNNHQGSAPKPQQPRPRIRKPNPQGSHRVSVQLDSNGDVIPGSERIEGEIRPQSDNGGSQTSQLGRNGLINAHSLGSVTSGPFAGFSDVPPFATPTHFSPPIESDAVKFPGGSGSTPAAGTTTRFVTPSYAHHTPTDHAHKTSRHPQSRLPPRFGPASTIAAPPITARPGFPPKLSASDFYDDNDGLGMHEVPRPMCQASVSYIEPKIAENRDGERRYIIRDVDNFIQYVLVEKCNKPGSECILHGPLRFQDFGIRTVCRQKFSLKRLLSLNEAGDRQIDLFKFPSCCICHQIEESPFASSNSPFNSASSKTGDRHRRYAETDAETDFGTDPESNFGKDFSNGHSTDLTALLENRED